MKKNQRYRDKFKWSFPNLKCPSVKINSNMKEKVRELKSSGITSLISEDTIKIAEEIRDNIQGTFQDDLSDGLNRDGDLLSKRDSSGRDRNVVCSYGFDDSSFQRAFLVPFSDISMKKFCFHRDLLGIIYNYFNRQPFYDRHVHFNVTAFNNEELPNDACCWHSHDHHTIVVQLLLHDLDLTHSHLQIAKNTHKIPFFSGPKSKTIDAVEEEMKSFPDSMIADGIGKMGTVLIADVRGYHRIKFVSGRTRYNLHAVINTGHTIKHRCGIHSNQMRESGSFLREEVKSCLYELDQEPNYIKNSLNLLNQAFQQDGKI